MNYLLCTALLLSSSAALAEDRNFDRTLNVTSSPNLSVTTGSGNIHLIGGSDNQVHIVGHIHSSHGWMSGGNESIEAHMQRIADNPPIVQNGNEIVIGEKRSSDLFRNISIDYDITLPRASNISANSGSGDVEIQDAGASLKAGTGSGSVRARGIRGAASLETGSGDIELSEAGSGDIKAETGSGSIRLSTISGGLKAETGSGDIRIDGHPTSDWKVESGSGNIQLKIGYATKCTLNASNGSGSIHINQPFTMQGDLDRHHVSASINGGGPVIKAETGSGDISVD